MARDRLDELLAATFAAARHELAEHGSLAPFGACAGLDGRVLRVEPGADVREDRAKAVDAIANELRRGARAGRYVTACVCTEIELKDVDARGTARAVRAHLEDGDGEAVDVFLPYKLGDDGTYEWGDLFAHEGEAQIFSGRQA